jgi:alkylation response protein AidB-like acyl-CoA dehydrogenase
MRFDWPDEMAAFRHDVRSYAREQSAADAIRWGDDDQDKLDATGLRNRQELDRRGWLRISWPAELGGQGQSPWYQFLLALELGYHDVEYGRGGTASMIGPALMRFGTEDQKAELVPKIWSGEITCALGYSEPDAGSDLASLRTRAVRDGDQYVISGSKIWSSNAHRNSHVWLACRTDPEARKHRGISIFIVPLDTPGITIRPIWVLSGHQTNEVFYDDVRVPASALVGQENQGWYIMANALDHERVTIGVNNYLDLARTFEESIAYLQAHRPDLMADPQARLRLAELKVDLHALRALLYACSDRIAGGQAPTKEASMGKVWATELRYRMSSMLMDLLGPAGLQEKTSAEPAAVGGRIEQMYRHAAQARFTGGANELQKTIIAERGLGLPRGA